MPVTKHVTYKDFTGGEWGELGEFRAAPNMYSGSNVVLYTNGLLGPRAGLHENTYTGDVMNGKPWGMYLIGRIGKPNIIFVDDKIYSTSEDNVTLGTVAHVATLDAAPTQAITATWYDPNENIYFTNPADSTYYINWADNTLTNLPVRNGGADNAGVQSVFLCRDRLYAMGDMGTGHLGGQMVYVSAAADFTNFSGGETFEVGYFNAVRSAMESQNSLMFSCLESTNNIGSGVGWYSLVGATPGGSLRRVNTQVAAEGQMEVVNAESGNIYFWSGWDTTEEDIPYLVSTNGAKFDEESWKHLRLQGTDRFGYYNARDKTLLYVSSDSNAGMMRCNGAWSRIDFEVDNIAGPICPTEQGTTFLVASGDVGVDVKIYEFISRPETPGFATDYSNQGDNSDVPINAYFALPAFQSDTKELRVRRVLVDMKKWNTNNSTGLNSFTVNVKTWGQYNLPSGSTDGEVVTSMTFSEDETLASTQGTLDRFVARIGQQGKAAAFQVSITGIVGCAIESVTVEFDEDDQATGRTI